MIDIPIPSFLDETKVDEMGEILSNNVVSRIVDNTPFEFGDRVTQMEFLEKFSIVPLHQAIDIIDKSAFEEYLFQTNHLLSDIKLSQDNVGEVLAMYACMLKAIKEQLLYYRADFISKITPSNQTIH